jgi:glucose/arabinose dehydrogenase
MFRLATTLMIVLVGVVSACAGAHLPITEGMGPNPVLPAPDTPLIPTVHVASAVGWPAGTTPTAAAGLAVKAFATGLDHPRWLYVLPNGDVLVAESAAPPQPDDGKGLRARVEHALRMKAGASVPSANRITLLRDTDADGVADVRSVFASQLASPFGMALVGSDLYVANTDAVVRFHYAPGQLQVTGPGETLAALPAGPRNHHWTKNIIASPDGRKLYATVGSNSNVAENGMAAEAGRAAIWEIDRASGQHRLYATGLRNPNGLAWVAPTAALWVAVNERDELGNDLVPDYMTAVQEGGFYGWPYSYFGQHVDARVSAQRPDLVARAITPDYALGAHTASLGLAYASHTALTRAFQQGMFVGQHGSWNRRPVSGYAVIFVPYSAGKPSGAPVDVLTDFIDAEGNARGRPVGVAVDNSGALLVADDVGDVVWRVAAERATAPNVPSIVQ